MGKDEFVHRVLNLIEIGETESAIKLATSFLKNFDQSMYEECLILSNAYNSEKRYFNLGMKSDDCYSIKCANGLLEIVKRAKSMVIYDRYTVKEEVWRKGKKVLKRKSAFNVLATDKKVAKKEETFSYELASRTERLTAITIEFAILTSVFTIGTFIFDDDLIALINSTVLSDFNVVNVVNQALFIGVFGAIFYPLFSGNIGHWIMGLKTINLNDGEDYNDPVKGFLREFYKSILLALIIPMVWIFFDKRRQQLYDKMTKTIVVRKNKSVLARGVQG